METKFECFLTGLLPQFFSVKTLLIANGYFWALLKLQ